MEIYNQFVMSLNNRFQHLPPEERKRKVQRIVEDLEKDTYAFTAIDALCSDDEDEEFEQEEIQCENDLYREERIRELQAQYNDGIIDEDYIDGLEQDEAIRSRCGQSDAHKAVLMGDLELIKALHAQGVSFEERDNSGHTPIYLAYLEDNQDVLNLMKDLHII